MFKVLKYLEGFPNLVFYVSEKIGLVRHFNQNILGKKANGSVSTPPIVQVNLEKVQPMPLRGETPFRRFFCLRRGASLIFEFRY